jgi:NCS1 family nucleobase:cation symporter-1
VLIFGAYLGVASGYTLNIFGALFTVVHGIGGWFAWVFVVMTTLVTLLQGSLSIYAGTDTAASIAETFVPKLARKSLKLRIFSMIPVWILCTTAALFYAHNFFHVFQEFLDVLVVLLVPWSMVNLVDFYFVRKGHYKIEDVFNPGGIYGRWNRIGLASWLLGAACAIPFANLTFYVGPVANALKGGDLSWVVSVVVSGTVYYLFGSNEAKRLAEISTSAGDSGLQGDSQVRPTTLLADATAATGALK